MLLRNLGEQTHSDVCGRWVVRDAAVSLVAGMCKAGEEKPQSGFGIFFSGYAGHLCSNLFEAFGGSRRSFAGKPSEFTGIVFLIVVVELEIADDAGHMRIPCSSQ